MVNSSAIIPNISIPAHQNNLELLKKVRSTLLNGRPNMPTVLLTTLSFWTPLTKLILLQESKPKPQLSLHTHISLNSQLTMVQPQHCLQKSF